MIYTYAFLPQPLTPLELPPGIAHAVELIGIQGLAALVEQQLDFEALQQNDQELLQAVIAHDRVLREMFRQTPILPLRFATRFASEESLRVHLQTHRDPYLQRLTQFIGKAEYTLKLQAHPLSVEPEPTQELQGRDYFLAKKRRYQTQTEQKQKQAAELQNLVDAIAAVYPDLVIGTTQEQIQTLYLLVEQAEESLLLSRVQAWQTQTTQWVLSLGEALPPYHFV